jgi:Flp pilus assembly pilin Flp
MTFTSVVLRLEDLGQRACSQEDGQALVEYSLLLALIAIVAFGAVNEFGLGVSSLYSKITAGVP